MVLAPRSAADITPEWLTSALRERRYLRQAEVATVHMEDAGGLRGFAGHVLRLKIRFSGDDADVPPSLIAKLPATDRFDARLAPGALAAYTNEIRWYERVAPLCPIRTPTLYWSGIDAGELRCCLLLEDLAHHVQVSHSVGPSRAQAVAAVEAIGRFHAKFTETSARPNGFRGAPTFAERVERAAVSVRNGWDLLLEAYRPQLPPRLRAAGESLAEGLAGLSTQGMGGAATLIHGDYKVENLLFSEAGLRPGVAVLDWQASGVGYGVEDVARFVSVSLPVERRREWEPDLLRRYAAAYNHVGPDVYSADLLWNGYRIALLVEFARSLGGLRLTQAGAFSTTVGQGPLRQQAINDWVKIAMMRRIAAISQTGAIELL